jgi:hypothetical protein
MTAKSNIGNGNMKNAPGENIENNESLSESYQWRQICAAKRRRNGEESIRRISKKMKSVVWQ